MTLPPELSQQRRAGADVESLFAAERALGVRLPSDLRSLLLASDGIDGWVGDGYLNLWSVAELVELNRSSMTSLLAPGLTLIGSNNIGDGYGFLEIDGMTRYVQVQEIGLSLDEAEPFGDSLSEFFDRIRKDG